MGNKQQYTVVGLGEVVWDVFSNQRRLGGAPANVAYHAAALGDKAVLASRVGQDALGQEALELLSRRGVDVSAVQQDRQFPTGTVQVTLDAQGQPSYVIDGAAAWAHPQWTPCWSGLIRRASVVCFGTLLQSSAPGREVLRRAREACSAGTVWLLDLNLRPPFDAAPALDAALDAATVVKLSQEEAVALSQHLGVKDAATWLVQQGGKDLVAVTRGQRGSLLITRDGSHTHPGYPLGSTRGDPVGAGDAFTAALAHHLVRGHPPGRINGAANLYAAHVASCEGAMPLLPAAVRQAATGAR